MRDTEKHSDTHKDTHTHTHTHTHILTHTHTHTHTHTYTQKYIFPHSFPQSVKTADEWVNGIYLRSSVEGLCLLGDATPGTANGVSIGRIIVTFSR